MASPKADSSAESDSSSLHEEDLSTRPEAERSQCCGGYDCQFVGEILPEEGECPICHLIYSDPHQMRCCGKRICGGCVEKIKAKSQPCPFCKVVDVSHYPDKAHMQYLGSYKVNCPNRSKGCEWEGQLADLDRHLNLEPTTEKRLKGCLFSRIKCRFCFELFERHFINTHQSNECPKRPYECAYCEYKASFEEVTQQHSNECPSAPVTCPNNCELVVFRSGLEHHRNHDCPMEIERCEFHVVGCQVELPRRDMPEHKRQNVAEHSVALSTTLQRAMADNVSLQGDITTLQGDITTLRGDITTLQGGLQGGITTRQGDIITLQGDITTLQGDITSLQGDITTLQGKMQVLIANNEQTTGAMRDSLNAMQDTMRDGQDKMQERITALSTRLCGVALLAIVAIVSIAVLAGVVTMRSGQHSVNGIEYREDQTGFCRFDNGMMESECIDKKGREEWRDELDSRMEQEQKEKRNELDSRMEQEQKERRDELDRRMEQEQKERRDELNSRMEQEQKEISRLQNQQNLILTHPWPHEDILPFEFEMKDFEKHRESGDMWHSPPFYTNINGYKMCIGVDARGEDRKYVSVSAYLMAGVADDYLKWPFQEDIKIELINQAGSSYERRNHVPSVKFRGTTVLESIQRVTTGEMSKVGLRIVHFISHDKLKHDGRKGTQYLKNDKLKFRVSVAPNVRTP